MKLRELQFDSFLEISDGGVPGSLLTPHLPFDLVKQFSLFAYMCDFNFKANEPDISLDSSCLSCRTEQLGSHWTDFHEIIYLSLFFRKSVQKIQV